MPVHRIIFRIDFSLNFNIIEKPGTVMRMMDSMPDELLSEILETRSERRIQGHAKSARESQILIVEPTTVHFTAESLDGIELDSLENDQRFLGLINLVQTYCQEFGVSEIRRAGFRVFVFDTLCGSKEERNCCLLSALDKDIVAPIEEKLGEISDCGYSFDGNSADGISYHLRFGPFSQDETQKYLKEFVREFDERKKYDSVLDLDLYESDFATPKVAFKKYLHPFIEKVNALVESIRRNTSC